jgi:hypothetical protein
VFDTAVAAIVVLRRMARRRFRTAGISRMMGWKAQACENVR